MPSKNQFPIHKSRNKVEFRDHYSLGRSTKLRFRGKTDQKVYVLDDVGRDQQLVMMTDQNARENDTATTTIKLGVHSNGSVGAALLRAIAACVSLFVLTVWVAFSVQCMFFLFMNVAGTYTPAEFMSEPPIANLLGCVAACPILVTSLARILATSLACTIDCWRGIATHPSSLWKLNFRSADQGEWPALMVFFGVPLLTCAIATLSSDTNESNDGEDQRGWYEWTMLVWAGSVCVFQIIYMELCLLNELGSCHKLLQHFRNTKNVLESIKVNLLLTQRQKYSGMRRERYLVENLGGSTRSNFWKDDSLRPVQFKYSLGTRLTKILPYFFDRLKSADDDDAQSEGETSAAEKPNYTIEEIFGNNSIITKNNWSLEQLFCADLKKGTSLTVVSGNASVAPHQILSGYICVGSAIVLIVLVVTGVLRWTEQSLRNTLFIVLIIFAACFIPMVVSLKKLREHQKSKVFNVTHSDSDTQSNSEEEKSKVCSVSRDSDGEIGMNSTIEEEKSKDCSVFSDSDGYIGMNSTIGTDKSKDRSVFSDSDGYIGMNSTIDTGKSKDRSVFSDSDGYIGMSSTIDTGKSKDRSVFSDSDSESDTGSDSEIEKSKGRSVFSDGDSDTDSEVEGANKVSEENEDYNQNCKIVVSVWENVRVTELKEWACYATAAIEITALFLWPLGNLFIYENTPIGVVFLVLAIHMIPSHYFNASNLLQEYGPIDDLDLRQADLSLCSCTSQRSEENEDRDLENKAFIANIVERLTRSRVTGYWIRGFAFLFVAFAFLFYAASTQGIFSFYMGSQKWTEIVHAEGFSWDPQPQLPYPVCEFQKGFTFPGQQSSSLANYAFLATLAFSSPEEAQPLLDQWFGSGTVIDDYEYVENYRISTGMENHPVTYKLFTFPDDPTSGIVSIRGSETDWNWISDIQLWMGGVFAQFIKHFNPLGYLWEPIMDEVVYLINSVQSKSLKEKSSYRFTTDFVETLYGGYEGRTFENIRVTGASLGGGMAILTGAITGASAISFSGLNAMFSRKTFVPPITEEQLNTRVFNTIPERDLIASIDQPGMLHQRMQCRGPKNSLMTCHNMFRSLCEIQYQCGSQGRPIHCWCVSRFGYPEPTQDGNVTWEEACPKESKALGDEL